MADNNEIMMKDILDELTGVNIGDVVGVEVLVVEDGQLVVGVDNAGVEGVIPKREFTADRSANLKDLAKSGDHFEALVLRRAGGDKENGEFIFSVTRLAARKAFEQLQKDFEADKSVEGKITGAVRGGLLVDVGARGFLPASLISDHYVSNLKPYVGQTLEFKITEIDPSQNRLILSRKDFVTEKREAAFENISEKIMPGDVVEGKVAHLTKFGAFVDLGGVTGLVHISEISYKRVEKPSDVLSPEQDVKVKVLEVDSENQRIALSIKQTQPSPFEQATSDLVAGDVVEGTVKSLTDFGAFVEIASGVQGLVHVSEISNDHVRVPSDVLSVNDQVEVRVLSIDKDSQRISLSMKSDDSNEASQNHESAQNEADYMDNDDSFSIGDIIGDELKNN
ncbi:30S ribosomal protein S1 [Holzapfeliella sp. JNUCC 72]